MVLLRLFKLVAINEDSKGNYKLHPFFVYELCWLVFWSVDFWIRSQLQMGFLYQSIHFHLHTAYQTATSVTECAVRPCKEVSYTNFKASINERQPTSRNSELSEMMVLLCLRSEVIVLFSSVSAASVFSLREVQLQKDPGHRSSMFQPPGAAPSHTHSQHGSCSSRRLRAVLLLQSTQNMKWNRFPLHINVS